MFQLLDELHDHLGECRGVESYPVVEGGLITCSLDRTAKIWLPMQENGVISYHVYKTFIGHKNDVINVRYDAKTNTIVTCSLEEVRNVIIWDIESATPLDELKGHGPVSALSFSPNGELLTGSWDKTARIWKNGWTNRILQGHTASVLAILGLPDGSVITGSSDSLIKIWYKNGESKTIRGHRQPVRGLAIVPGLGFCSVGNDGYLILWSLDGQQLTKIKAHRNLIYCVKVLSTGEIVTGSEDNTIKIWKNGTCVQTIRFPKSIWEVAELSNGDIAVATTDSITRVFTRSKTKPINETLIKKFHDEIEKFRRNTETKIDVSKFPDTSALQTPGPVGKILQINNQGVGEVYQMAETGWVKIGYLIDKPTDEEEEDPNVIEGKEYDIVIPVEISQGQTLKLGYNAGQDPMEVARDFITKYELEDYFLEEISDFIIKNVPFSLRNRGVEDFKDPYNDGRYKATEASIDKNEPNYNPDLQFPIGLVLFLEANFAGISKKILESKALTECETHLFQSVLETCKAKKQLNKDQMNLCVHLIKTLSSKDVFPMMDVWRMIVLDHTLDTQSIQELITFGQSGSDVLKMLTCRFVCNLFVNHQDWVMNNMSTLIKSMIQPSVTNNKVAYGSILVNFATILCKTNKNDEKQILFDALINLVVEEKDPLVVKRYLVAIGTLCHNKTMWKIKVLEIKSILNKLRLDKDCDKTINQLFNLEKEL